MSKTRSRQVAVAVAPELVSASIVTATFGPLDSIGRGAYAAANALQASGARIHIDGYPDRREFGNEFVADERQSESCTALDFRDPVLWQRDPSRRTIGFVNQPTSIAPVAWEIPMRRVDAVVVPSRWIAETVKPFARAVVAAPPVDPAYSFRPKVRGSVFRVVFCVAPGLEHRKGWDIARAAFLAAFGEQEDVELVVRSPYPIDLVTGDRRIQLEVGRRSVDAMAHLYQTADVLLYPSRAQSFGGAALESMACGTPVIHTGATGMRAFTDRSMQVSHRAFPGLNGVGEWREAHVESIVDRLRQAYAGTWPTAAADSAWVKERYTREAYVSALLPIL